ncbi:hypothetical protein BJP39_00445 [Streptomyces sp. CC77]|nr:hypothetical protein BJP39_00445 [Streptomyces sp. CC77]
MRSGTTTVCGVCRRPGEPVVRYTITAEDGRAAEVDRCADHAESFESALTQRAPEAPQSTSRPRRRTKVTTVEAIDSEKAASVGTGPEAAQSTSRPRRRTKVTTVEEIQRSKAVDKA